VHNWLKNQVGTFPRSEKDAEIMGNSRVEIRKEKSLQNWVAVGVYMRKANSKIKRRIRRWCTRGIIFYIDCADLAIVTGRRNNVHKSQRFCKYCEKEKHIYNIPRLWRMNIISYKLQSLPSPKAGVGTSIGVEHGVNTDPERGKSGQLLVTE